MGIIILIAVIVVAAVLFFKQTKKQNVSPSRGDPNAAKAAAGSKGAADADFIKTVEDKIRKEACMADNERERQEVFEYFDEYAKQKGLDERQIQGLDDMRQEMVFRIFKEEADKGDAVAQYRYGMLVAYNTDWPDRDDIEFDYILKSANQGFADALEHLAFIYRTKKNDREQAQRIYLLAAEKGNADAMSALGSFAQQNNDYSTAFSWYEKSIEAAPKDVSVLCRCIDFWVDCIDSYEFAQRANFVDELKNYPEIDTNELFERTLALSLKALDLVPKINDGDLQRINGYQICMRLADLYELPSVPVEKRNEVERYDPKKAFSWLVQAEIYAEEDNKMPRQRMQRIYDQTGVFLSDEEWAAAEHVFETRHGISLHEKK